MTTIPLTDWLNFVVASIEAEKTFVGLGPDLKWLTVPHAVNLGVVLLLPGRQRQELLRHAGVHPVAVDRHVLAGEQDLVLAIHGQARLHLHVEAVLEAAWNRQSKLNKVYPTLACLLLTPRPRV